MRIRVLNCVFFFFFCRLVVFCIGSGLQVFAQSVQDIIIGRAVGGLGVGALRYSSRVSFRVVLCQSG